MARASERDTTDAALKRARRARRRSSAPAGQPTAVMSEEDEPTCVLFEAAAAGLDEAVVNLLSAGAKVYATDQNFGTTALHWASAGGHRSTVLLLLKAGATVDAIDSSGWSPLFYATSPPTHLQTASL